MADTGLRNKDGVKMPSVFAYARLENDETVLRELRNLADGVVKDRVQAAILSGAELVAQEARMRAPVGTRPPRKGAGVGRLRKSIRVKGIAVKSSKHEVGAYVEADYPENARIRARVPSQKRRGKAGYKEYYAFAVEYGTGKMAAQPFLNPALEAKAKEVQDKIASALDELCKETDRKI